MRLRQHRAGLDLQPFTLLSWKASSEAFAVDQEQSAGLASASPGQFIHRQVHQFSLGQLVEQLLEAVASVPRRTDRGGRLVGRGDKTADTNSNKRARCSSEPELS